MGKTETKPVRALPALAGSSAAWGAEEGAEGSGWPWRGLEQTKMGDTETWDGLGGSKQRSPEKIQARMGRGKGIGGCRGCHTGEYRGTRAELKVLSAGVELFEHGEQQGGNQIGAKPCRGEESWLGYGGKEEWGHLGRARQGYESVGGVSASRGEHRS